MQERWQLSGGDSSRFFSVSRRTAEAESRSCRSLTAGCPCNGTNTARGRGWDCTSSRASFACRTSHAMFPNRTTTAPHQHLDRYLRRTARSPPCCTARASRSQKRTDQGICCRRPQRHDHRNCRRQAACYPHPRPLGMVGATAWAEMYIRLQECMTIAHIFQSAAPSTCTDLAPSDPHSLCILRSEAARTKDLTWSRTSMGCQACHCSAGSSRNQLGTCHRLHMYLCCTANTCQNRCLRRLCTGQRRRQDVDRAICSGSRHRQLRQRGCCCQCRLSIARQRRDTWGRLVPVAAKAFGPTR